MIEFAHQSPTDLRLVVTTQPLPSTLFHTFKQMTHPYQAWRFIFAIIGESHVITVQYQQQTVLQELLACTTIPADVSTLHRQGFSEMQPHCYQTHGYQINIRFDEPDTLEDPQLWMRFPAHHQNSPVTKIKWQQNAEQIQWWTVHTYPIEDDITVVHTYSTFDLIERG